MSSLSLYTYEELNAGAQKVARYGVIAHAVSAYEKEKKEVCTQRKNAGVNQRLMRCKSLSRVTNQLCSVRRLQSMEDAALGNVIKANLCHFDLEGHYYSYTEARFYGG